MIRGAVVVASVMVLVIGLQWIELRAVRADLGRVEARAIGLEEAARWRAQDDRRRADAAALDMELQQGAGADAPLSDYLRAGAGRVWPSR